jgi:P-type Ca2+ transporter type 2C
MRRRSRDRSPPVKESPVHARQSDAPGSGLEPQARDVAWHTLTVERVVQAEQVDPQRGLSAAEAASRAQRFGPNELAEGAAEPRWHAFIRQYRDPMQIALLAAGIGSLYPLKQFGTGLLLILLTLANAVMGLQQEGKAAAAMAALRKMMIVKARVTRDGQLAEIPTEQLVPGDLVSVEAGDVVPADGRLVNAATLEVGESALTGESLPVAKATDAVEGADTPLGDRTDMVYMHTNVTRGAGEFVVTATGMATEVGRISGMLQAEEAAKTPLSRQLDRLSRQVLLIAAIAIGASVGLNLAHGGTFTAVFQAAVAFAVAAIPVQLPAVVTAILAYGSQQLAKAGAIMKQLRSTETLGATSAINTDKTDTLTLNQMTAVQMAVLGRRFAIDGTGYSSQGRINRVAGESAIPLDPILMPMVLASDAVIRDGELIGDPTEGALVALAAKGGIDAVSTRERYPRIAELPFDAAYKLMATFHRMNDESGKEVIRCFVKGAPDQLLARAATVLDADADADADAGPVPVAGKVGNSYLAENRRLGEQGLRVMATARKDFDIAAFDPAAELLPRVTELELLALVGIVDPPRPTAKASIATAKAAGIEVRMITGDHAITAAAIARQLDIDGRVITGAEFEAMSDDEALKKIDDIGVIARVTPEHKVRLVDLLKKQGHIVAMTGDGVNDAPALKKADIGIAMGITGTEVAKQAAVMILTDDDFSTIIKAVKLGRGLYDSLTSYVRFQMGSLFGYVITFLGASVFNIAGGVPLLPLQTLWVSFATQATQSIGLTYTKPAADVMERKPRPPSRPILSRGETHVARLPRADHGDRHPKCGQLGRTGSRARRRPDHGYGHARAFQPVLLVRAERQPGIGVLPRYLRRQDVSHHDRGLLRLTHHVNRPRAIPHCPQDHHARCHAMAHLHGCGTVDHRGRGDSESGAAAARYQRRPHRLAGTPAGSNRRLTAVAAAYTLDPRGEPVLVGGTPPGGCGWTVTACRGSRQAGSR